MKVQITEKDILRVLVRIQRNCLNNDDCSDCPFNLGYRLNEDSDEMTGCQLRRLFTELAWYPTSWDLEEIACILKQ